MFENFFGLKLNFTFLCQRKVKLQYAVHAQYCTYVNISASRQITANVNVTASKC
jgi:hypothetical protein